MKKTKVVDRPNNTVIINGKYVYLTTGTQLYLRDAKNYTVPKVLKELEKKYLTILADDKYHQRYLLTAKQKKILKAFDIEEDEYKNSIT